MATDEETSRDGETDRTARTVGQLVKYSREVNQSETVGEVGSYALEATFHVMDGHPSPTVFEVGRGGPTVLASMAPGYETGDDAGPIVRRALADGRTTVVADGVAVGYEADDVLVASPDDFGKFADDADRGQPATVSIAAPSTFTEDRDESDEMGTGEDARDGEGGAEVGVVLLVQWDALESVESHHVKPVAYLADHLATAVANIRSRERLERARNDLARRKEMIEMYDRLLRHDLGNDLQIITGYSEALLSLVEDDDQVTEYASKIVQTGRSAADLVERVGDVVKTIESETEPEARDLEPILSAVVSDVDAKFETLTVEYDPTDFQTEVYAGHLLDSVFANVLSNAAVHNEGHVTAAVYAEEPSADAVVVGFADDGSGVPEDVRDELFEMGKKGPDSDGTGFGLGLVRALVASYGGSVAVGDSDAGGAEFQITLERA